MSTRINFSQNISKFVPAHKLDEVEQSMLNSFNNNTEDNNETDYAGSGDEYQDKLSQNEESDNNSSGSSIGDNSENYNENGVCDGCDKRPCDCFCKHCEQFKEECICNLNVDEIEEMFTYRKNKIDSLINIENLNISNKDMDHNKTSINFKNNPQEQINSNIIIQNKYYIKKKYGIDFDNLKFKCLFLRINIVKLRKNNKIDKHIKELNNNLKLDSIRWLKELDDLDKEFVELQNIEKVLPVYNKLKEKINILEFNDGGDELQNLFAKLDEEKINGYVTMSTIGTKIINEKLDSNKIKLLLKNYSIDRLNRIIIKCKRISILSNYINISNIAISGISHFLRDSKEDIFNLLIEYLKINPINV